MSGHWLWAVGLALVGLFLVCFGGVAAWRWFQQPPGADQLKQALMARNPGFDGKIALQERDGRIVKLSMPVDQIADLEPIGPLTDLDDLDLFVPADRKTDLTDLTPIGRLKKLTHLRISGVPVDTFDWLKDMKTLTSLDLGGTKINDLSVLRGLPIANLRLGATGVKNLRGLEEAPLEKLDCAYCYPLESLDGLPTGKLRWLSIASTDVASLAPLKDAKNLEYLDFHWTPPTIAERPKKGEQAKRSLHPDDLALILRLSNLQEVIGEFTDEEAAHLRQKLPALRIVKSMPPGKNPN